MNPTITSTTDSEENVKAAMGGLQVKEEANEEKSAPESSDSDETLEESETSETSDGDDEASDDDDSSEESEDDKAKDEKPKKKNGFKKRIDKLSRKASEAEQRAQYWENEARKNQKQAEVKDSPAAQPVLEGKPKAESYEKHEDFVEALADWKYEQRKAQDEQKIRESEVKSAVQKRAQSYQEKAKSFAEANEDFNEVLQDVSHIPMPIVVQDAIMSADNGPELAYELAKNPEEYKRICSLPALEAARAIGKFEAKFIRETEAPTEIKKTKAPPPIAPIRSKGSASAKDPEKMDYQEYKKWRAAQ